MEKIPLFKFWCQKVLPLVYDDSLSYYEVLCKVVDYLNNLIKDNNQMIDNIEELQAEINQIQEWIANLDTTFVEKVIAEYIASMVFFGLTDSGYFVAYIPGQWKNIEFGTTEYDMHTDLQPEYGHLVLMY